jgi:hypothetical protein
MRELPVSHTFHDLENCVVTRPVNGRCRIAGSIGLAGHVTDLCKKKHQQES